MGCFDILIIGGGHAGAEAAWAAASFGHSVGLVTFPGVPIASMPCNPSIGGVGKGQVVREIDALGGIMGIAADRSAIQYRILNESKGYAVQSTRAQVDRWHYACEIEALLRSKENIQIITEAVNSVQCEDNGYVVETDGRSYRTTKLIVTTGTFLDGKLHKGSVTESGGRESAPTAEGLQMMFPELTLVPYRFKTGTPPRLDCNSLDFSVMIPQKSDPRAQNFSLHHKPYKRHLDQVACYLTHTTDETMEIIRSNRESSPLFNGQIAGVGPRYCPSIEDKAFRYLDRNRHHVFVEPEGLNSPDIYPNGMSTSLPIEVQEQFIRSIPGFENAEFLHYGYAVEYDVIDTSYLNNTLEHQSYSGLYFAGQVNGTSGYEEAAGQGLIAGFNAVLSLENRSPLVLDRAQSYIGLLIDDLTHNRPDEPYRLFTARCENRLYMREDNTIERMNFYRSQLLLSDPIDHVHSDSSFETKVLWPLIERVKFYRDSQEHQELFQQLDLGPLTKDLFYVELLKRPQLEPITILQILLEQSQISISDRVIRQLAISAKYRGYIDRATAEVQRYQKLDKKRVNWQSLLTNSNISFECRQRIERCKPETFAQLRRIEGIRQATLALVAGAEL